MFEVHFNFCIFCLYCPGSGSLKLRRHRAGNLNQSGREDNPDILQRPLPKLFSLLEIYFLHFITDHSHSDA
jgi:hypothetical protein